jgi:hypothetical protein
MMMNPARLCHDDDNDVDVSWECKAGRVRRTKIRQATLQLTAHCWPEEPSHQASGSYFCPDVFRYISLIPDVTMVDNIEEFYIILFGRAAVFTIQTARRIVKQVYLG